MDKLKYKLGEWVFITRSKKEAQVRGRAEYMNNGPRYLLLYKDNDGEEIQDWWHDKDIKPLPDQDSA